MTLAYELVGGTILVLLMARGLRQLYHALKMEWAAWQIQREIDDMERRRQLDGIVRHK